MVEAQYSKADLNSCIPQHLNPDQQTSLLTLLQKFEDLFNGMLGCFKHLPKATMKLIGDKLPDLPKVTQYSIPFANQEAIT